MSNEVYANGMELACKAGAGKIIAAMPDVCLSPPPPPAGPLPLPYPNTAMASDTTDGSTSVKISGKEVMLKDKSCFKKSVGDEAATKSQGMGVITACIGGKAYFAMWSSDVKIEGENAVRHLDITTGNHNPAVGNRSVPFNFADMGAAGNIKECDGAVNDMKTKCAGQAPDTCTDDCRKAQKCILKPKDDDKEWCCSPDTTGHHLVEVHCFTPTSGRSAGARLPGCTNYRDKKAPCTCASESRADGFHGVMHACQSQFEAAYEARGTVLHSYRGAGALRDGGGREMAKCYWNYGEARDAGAKALNIAAGCNEECTKKQLDAYHTGKPPDGAGIKENTPMRTDPDAGTRSSGGITPQQETAINNEVSRISGVTPGPAA